MNKDYIIYTCIFIIFLIIIDMINSSKIEVEGYDAKISNLTEIQCGTECTTGQNCYGFGYKPIEKSCYLANKAILGAPENSLYTDEYSKLDRRCNKINRIKDDDFVDDKSITRNSVYICSDGENNINTEFQYANFGSTSLEDTNGNHMAPTTVTYDLHIVDYPTEKKDVEPIGLASYNLKKKNQTESKTNNKYGFVESNKEFLGQYLLAHQCVVNVPLYDCLKFCEDNEYCAGTEWNYSLMKVENSDYYVYEKVCCPKGIIKKIIPRRDKVGRGKFYVKQKIEDMTDRNRVIVSQADFNNDQNIPSNKMFVLSESNPENANIDKVASLPGFVDDNRTQFS